MTISNMKPISQKEFDVLPLFLSKQSDNEIDFIDNDDTVNGIVYICIGSEDEWVGFNFKAHITKLYTAGELWKDNYGTHTIDTPSVEISNVTNITVSYNDSNVGDNETLDIDYTTRIDEIKTLISNFIYVQELTAPSKHNTYTTYNV